MDTAGSSRGRSGESMLSEELYQARLCIRESIRWIEAQEVKMLEIGHCDSYCDINLLDFRSDMVVFSDEISHLSQSIRAIQNAGWIGNKGESMETRSKIRDGGEMETGGKSSERSASSLELENLLHRAGILTGGEIGRDAEIEELFDLFAVEAQEWIVGQADSQLRWETVHELTAQILLKFEEVVGGDIVKVFEEQKIRDEAMAVLRFGFRLPLFSEQIDELRHEMCNILRSFSPENKDIRSTMKKFISEPYLSRICKLQLISERISMLQQMYPDFDSKVKSTIIKLKSESFLSAMEELKDESPREGQEDSTEMEEKRFAAYRLYWERIWGKGGHSFENQTLLSPMQFTHCTPRHIPTEAVAGSTLQIYSIKVSLVKPNVLPLPVYGVVAVRDAVDRHRNPLFVCSREDCQILGENDSFLHLTGPVRAIVSMDTVYIEIQLIVKGKTKSEDTTLISTFDFYNADNSGTYLAKNAFCTVELCCEQLKQSVQATILSVGVTPKQESLPFPHGGRVVCSSLPQDGNEDIAGQESSRQVLLLDSKGGRMPMTENGYLDLARSVVSVELNGKLQVLIMADSQTEIAAQFVLASEKYNTSKCECSLADGSKVEITVAWSLVHSKMLQSDDSHEDSGMVTTGNSKGRSDESILSEELCQAAIFMQKSICWIQAQEKKMVKIGHYGSAEYKNLQVLKLDMYELSNKIFGRVDYKTQKRIRAMQNACWISNKGKLTDTPSKIGDDIEMETGGKSSKGRSGEFNSARIGNGGRMVQTQSKTGDGGKSVSKQFNEQEQFKELPINNSIPIAESVRNKIEEAEAEAETVTAEVAPRVSFKLALLSRQFDELWDNMSQLVSTEPKFLAICMLIREPFARYCSTLKFISAVFDRLGQWVLDFRERMESIKEDEDRDKDVEAVDEYEAAKVAEEYYFNAYRRGWECRRSKFGSFEDPTLLSPMYFTQSIPGHTQVGAEIGRTMQVYSIKVAEREGFTLEWPLKVYGVVAARDVVDYRRNLLFLRTRDDCQILTTEHPFLHLTGPSRAIMSEETVTIEVHLKLKGTVESKDTTLISKAFFYDYDGVSTCLLRGLCDIDLCCDHLEQSHQATILGVRVVKGSLPCDNGIKIVCSVLAEDKTEGDGKRPSGRILLLDSQAGEMPVGEEGYLDLSRQVVSVKSRGRLEILMQAGEINRSVVFPTKFSNISQKSCKLGDCEVQITVAWSLLVESQHDISVMGSIHPYAWESIPPMPIMKLVDAC